MEKTILVIDDSPTIRKFITKHLQAYSSRYKIMTAADGAEGLKLALNCKPDVILLDFLLPDMNGEDVCHQLIAHELTSAIPVILMSSSTPDITRTEGKFNLIKRSLIKPFSPQLLCAGVNSILNTVGETADSEAENTRHLTSTTKTTASSPATSTTTASAEKNNSIAPSFNALAFKGNTSYFPLISALRGIFSHTLTGLFRFQHPTHLMELYFKDGLFLLATTRDTLSYFKDAPIAVSDEEKPLLEELKKFQSQTGQTVFQQLAERGFLPKEKAAQMTLQYGAFMFSLAWSSQDCEFEFERLNELPPFLKYAEPVFSSANIFALETLRLVGIENLTGSQWGASDGTPAYTSSGYRLIQELALNEEEIAFANQVGKGGQSLETITATINVDSQTARSILFRFLILDVFDYWPAPTT